MIVYGTSMSPFVRKVLVALYEKGATFDHKPVFFHADDPGFQAASPVGKIPALDDDGYLLADSSAILHYLDAKLPTPGLIPAEAKAGAGPFGSRSSATRSCSPRSSFPSSSAS